VAVGKDRLTFGILAHSGVHVKETKVKVVLNRHHLAGVVAILEGEGEVYRLVRRHRYLSKSSGDLIVLAPVVRGVPRHVLARVGDDEVQSLFDVEPDAVVKATNLAESQALVRLGGCIPLFWRDVALALAATVALTVGDITPDHSLLVRLVCVVVVGVVSARYFAAVAGIFATRMAA